MTIYNQPSNVGKQLIMLKELSNNLNILMAKARLTSNELARKINIPATTIKRIRNNEQANPTITTLLPIAKYFSISLDQLIGNRPLIAPQPTQNKNKLNEIPLLSWQECIHYDCIKVAEHPHTISIEKNLSEKAFGLVNEHHDLEFFPNGAILIVEPTHKPKNGDFVIVTNQKQNLVSVRKYISEIDQIYLKPLIKGIEICALTTEYRILGVIIQYKFELANHHPEIKNSIK